MSGVKIGLKKPASVCVKFQVEALRRLRDIMSQNPQGLSNESLFFLQTTST